MGVHKEELFNAMERRIRQLEEKLHRFGLAHNDRERELRQAVVLLREARNEIRDWAEYAPEWECDDAMLDAKLATYGEFIARHQRLLDEHDAQEATK